MLPFLISPMFELHVQLPRNHSSRFENHKTAFEEGSGRGGAYIEDVSTAGMNRDQGSMEKEEIKA